MNYPIVIHKDVRSDYGVTVPDLPGCYSAARTLDEALMAAREAIELHLEGLAEEGQSLPLPGSLEQHQANREYRGGVWAVVPIDASTLRGKVQRLNITMPERVVAAVDHFASEHGETRSGLLVRAVTEYIGRAEGKPIKPTRRKRS